MDPGLPFHPDASSLDRVVSLAWRGHGPQIYLNEGCGAFVVCGSLTVGGLPMKRQRWTRMLALAVAATVVAAAVGNADDTKRYPRMWQM
jgi:hypothetical protein